MTSYSKWQGKKLEPPYAYLFHAVFQFNWTPQILRTYTAKRWSEIFVAFDPHKNHFYEQKITTIPDQLQP